jgi:hypothetical protein
METTNQNVSVTTTNKRTGVDSSADVTSMQQFTNTKIKSNPGRIVDQRRTLVVNHLQFCSLTLFIPEPF